MEKAVGASFGSAESVFIRKKCSYEMKAVFSKCVSNRIYHLSGFALSTMWKLVCSS